MNVEAILQILRDKDSFAAISELNRLPDESLGDAYNELVRYLYWNRKNLNAAVAFARAGIQKLIDLSEALESTDRVLALKLKGAAKGLAYDLASFTWLGWDEPDINCKGHAYVGIDAALANLRLTVELALPPISLSRAHWMVGAHWLSHGNWDMARAEFLRAAPLAASGEAPAEELLSLGFAALAADLSGIDPSAAASLAEIRSRLVALDDGPDFDSQIETAKRVFARLDARD